VISSAQCRAARALIEWSREDLAAASKVAARTIVDFERGARQPIHSTQAAIRGALESAGVIFVEGNGEGPGVRLRKGGAAGARAVSIPIEDLNAENDE
jgi:transcriptional regulator with XRE-family HTH domain